MAIHTCMYVYDFYHTFYIRVSLSLVKESTGRLILNLSLGKPPLVMLEAAVQKVHVFATGVVPLRPTAALSRASPRPPIPNR